MYPTQFMLQHLLGSIDQVKSTNKVRRFKKQLYCWLSLRHCSHKLKLNKKNKDNINCDF